jgi:hypothetical protein
MDDIKLKLLERIANLDWCIGYELTVEQQNEIYNIKVEAFNYLESINYYDPWTMEK